MAIDRDDIGARLGARTPRANVLAPVPARVRGLRGEGRPSAARRAAVERRPAKSCERLVSFRHPPAGPRPAPTLRPRRRRQSGSRLASAGRRPDREGCRPLGPIVGAGGRSVRRHSTDRDEQCREREPSGSDRYEQHVDSLDPMIVRRARCSARLFENSDARCGIGAGTPTPGPPVRLISCLPSNDETATPSHRQVSGAQGQMSNTSWPP